MRRADNLQQAAAPLNNYQFDFGLPGMSKPSGSLKDQKPQSLNSASQPSPGWSASPGGWGSSQPSTQAFDFLGKTTSGVSKPNVSSQPRPQDSVSSTYDFLGKPNPVGGGGGGYYGSARPQAGNVAGMGDFLGQTQSQSKGGVDLTGRSWGQSPTSKLVAAGIAGVIPSKKDDVFGDLLGGSFSRSSGPLKQQTPASSAPFGMGNMNSSLPETRKEPPRQTQPAKPAPFSYTAMFNSSSAQPATQKPAPKPQPKGGDPFADISFSKPSTGATKSDPFVGASDPFMFASKPQGSAPPQVGRAHRGDPFAAFGGSNSGGTDQQFESMFAKPSVSKVAEDPLEAMLSSSRPPKSAQSHEGWGDAFGSAAESNSFADEGVTTELEGLGAPPPGVTGSTAFQKGSTFYKEGQFPNAIKWLSWAVELMQKEKGSKATLIEVLTRRISCFKEIGEYKKAIADCTMACEMNPGNVDLLMQRAHLYESCEKYKLGMTDLREVLKIEPSHRMATLTLARLNKMMG